MDTKKCSKCGTTQNISEFGKDSDKPGGHTSQCKECRRKYYHKNKPKISAYHRRYYDDHVEEIAAYHKTYHEKNKVRISEYAKKYHDDNKGRIEESRLTKENAFGDEFLKQCEEDDQVLRKLREENEKKWAQYKIRAV